MTLSINRRARAIANVKESVEFTLTKVTEALENADGQSPKNLLHMATGAIKAAISCLDRNSVEPFNDAGHHLAFASACLQKADLLAESILLAGLIPVIYIIFT